MTSTRPTPLGVTHGRLARCPAASNCVSTQADDAEHRIEPFPFSGPAATALQRLKAVISRQPRMKIVSETENYLHLEAKSFLFRFVDDVEFFADETAGLLHFRSASRLGSYDFGVNRKRMETIRAEWKKKG